MSRMLRLPVLFLLLVLTTAACVHAPRTTSPASTTAQTGKKMPAAKQAAPTSAPPATPGQPAPAVSIGAAPEAAPVAALPPTGFGDLAWGASAKSNPGLAPYDADAGAGVTTCVWPQGPKDIVGAPIRDAFYEFFQDRFYHVWIDFDGMAAYKTALAGLTRTYGPPTKEIPEKYYHTWALGDVNIYCAYHPGENEGDVSFFYQPIYDRMLAARKAIQGRHAAGKVKP